MLWSQQTPDDSNAPPSEQLTAEQVDGSSTSSADDASACGDNASEAKHASKIITHIGSSWWPPRG